MIIQTETGVHFDLPTELEMELTRYNVLLCDIGEQTAPITLPGSPHNLKLIGYSNRIDSLLKPLTDLTVLVSDGLFVRWCNMGIHTANEEEGISCTLYFESGDFYSVVGNTRLIWLVWPIIKHPIFDTVSLEIRKTYLIDLLKAEYNTPSVDSKFGIAAVGTTQSFTWRVNKKDSSGTITSVDITEAFILNDFEKYQYDYQVPVFTLELVNRFAGEFQQVQIVDSATVNIARGYGMTPFLKLSYVLQFIFERFGYGFDKQSVIGCISQFDKICMLNNVADAIYSGILNFKQLLPDVTIKEFVSKVEEILCGKFVFNSTNKTVFFKSYKQAITSNADIDLTEFICTKPKMNESDFKKIRIVDENATPIEDTSESQVETIDLSFKFVKLNTISENYNSSYFSTIMLPNYRYHFSLTRTLVYIEEITHLNSSIVINSEKQSDKNDNSVQIYFAYINNSLVKTFNYQFQKYIFPAPPPPSSNVTVITMVVKYKTSCRIFEGSGTNDLDYIKLLYNEYIEFNENSNIPITVEMNIPFEVLDKLDLQIPKTIQGQKVLIEKIVEKRGSTSSDSKTQQITFRTLRSFKSRT